MAAELGLRVAAKPDSQEICFVPDQDHARFIRQYRGGGDTAGEIVTTDGTVVGRHEGLERFTIGQRKGLGMAFGEPRYVVRIEPATRRVVVGTKDDLARRELTAGGANWLAKPPRSVLRGEDPLSQRAGGGDGRACCPGGRFAVHFDEPCFGVAPGQAAVCYQGDRLLGGGWID